MCITGDVMMVVSPWAKCEVLLIDIDLSLCR